MSETTVVDARLDKLEQDNRRLKLALGALLLVLAAVPLIGAVMPEQVQDTVRARQFRVIDRNGINRVFMSDGGISYYDENGINRAFMSTSGISYFDENDNLRAAMADGGIAYYDENGTIRAGMSAEGIVYLDENQTMRAQLGRVQSVIRSTGAEITYPAQVVLYDADDTVIWSAVGR